MILRRLKDIVLFGQICFFENEFTNYGECFQIAENNNSAEILEESVKMIKHPFSEYVFSTRNLFSLTKFKSDSADILFYNDIPLIGEIKNNESQKINWLKKADVIRYLKTIVIIVRPENCRNIPEDDMFININYDYSCIKVDNENQIYNSIREKKRIRNSKEEKFYH